jgi:hypothetical protein
MKWPTNVEILRHTALYHLSQSGINPQHLGTVKLYPGGGGGQKKGKLRHAELRIDRKDMFSINAFFSLIILLN